MRLFRIASLVVLVLPALALQARSSEDVPPAAPGAARPDKSAGKESEQRRILHLASGQSIRVVSRWAEERWEYRAKSGWKSLSPGMVVEVNLEKDVLREWRALRETADLKSPLERVRLASWAATAGLLSESLEELDAALLQDPDHVGAREVLRAHWFFTVPAIAVEPARLSAAEEDLLRFGASMGPAGRELAANELAKHPDRERLTQRVAKELRSNVVTRRAFATLALRRVLPGIELKALVLHAVLDPSADVRAGAAFALKAAEEPALCAPLVKALLANPSGAVRARAAEALGHMGYAAAVEPLVARLATAAAGGGASPVPHAYIYVGSQKAYIQDFDVEVAQFQAVADPQVNVLVDGQVTEVGVVGELEMSYAVEQQVIRRSLEKLTGEKPGRASRDWLAWWETNGSKWRSQELSRPKTGETSTPKRS